MKKLIGFYTSLHSKRAKRITIITLTIFIIGGITLYFALPTIVSHYLERKIGKIETTKKINIDIEELTFEGVTKIKVAAIRIIPSENDTLLAIKNCKIQFNFWQLLFMNADLKSASFESIKLKTIKNKEYCNYRFLFTSKKTASDTLPREINFSRITSSILNQIFRSLPANLNINQLLVHSIYFGQNTTISANNIHIKDRQIDTKLEIKDSLISNTWHIDGVLDKSNRLLSGNIFPLNKGKADIPYIFQHLGAKASFSTLSFELKVDKSGSSEVFLTGKAAFKSLDLNHPRLSPEDIHLGNGAITFKTVIGKSFFELDSTSKITFNKLSFSPYIRLEKSDKWRFITKIDQSHFEASALFESLPKGLFNSLEQIKVGGYLSYHFFLDVDLNQPDSLKLESSLRREKFSLKSTGELTKINGSFLYAAYENGQPVRTFIVGEENSSFRPLESISPLLQQAVLQSEDGQFYHHRGFRLDALREALIHDIKVKRFARGGSTISMQLVKNVFLNRRKNIARKLEEALLVWLIEENRLSSKKRMFEVYLNIAEWGPRVYGIGEASKFYFDKEPNNLTLNESIFLASIIPSPKRYTWAFDGSGYLKQNRSWQFNRVAERLFRTGYITADERASFIPEVTLTGVAKESLAIIADTTSLISAE